MRLASFYKSKLHTIEPPVPQPARRASRRRISDDTLSSRISCFLACFERRSKTHAFPPIQQISAAQPTVCSSGCRPNGKVHKRNFSPDLVLPETIDPGVDDGGRTLRGTVHDQSDGREGAHHRSRNPVGCQRNQQKRSSLWRKGARRSRRSLVAV